jgi:hypothetical protein
MRKVEVPVYKFEELSEEVQEALKEGSKAEGISEAVKDFIEERLAASGLKNLMVDDFSIGDENQENYIKVSGAMTDSLVKWEDEDDFNELSPLITFCLLDEEDIEEDTNKFGISVGGTDMTDEDKEAARDFIEFKLDDILDLIMDTVSEMMDEDQFETDEAKVLEYLNQYEYLVDGTAFSEEEYVK